MNLADAITQQARARPHAVAIIQPRGPILHYAELERAVRRTAQRFRREGIAPGDVVGVAMRNEPLHILVLLALARLGAVSIAVMPQLAAELRADIVKRFEVKAIVSDPKAPPVDGCARIEADPQWLEPGGEAAPAPEGGFDGSKTWRIALSSGTTGAPKGAAHTHDGTLLQMLLRRAVVEVGDDARFLASADMNVTFGLNPILRHLMAGTAVAFPRTLRTEDYPEAIDRYAITHLSTSPITLRGLLAVVRGGTAQRFPSLRHVSVSGGLIPPDLLRAAAQRLTRNLWSVYGATEVGTLAIADRNMLMRYPGTVGRTVPWVEMQVVDEEGRPLPPGKSGELRYRGLSFSRGYHADAKATAKSFRDGWFHPGDTGSVSGDGMITLEGRSDDLINLSGNKVQPEVVERVLQTHPEVEDAAVFGVKGSSGRTALFAAIVTRGVVTDEDLAAQCREKLSAVHTPQRFLRLAELPRNAAGKVSRTDLASRVTGAARR